MSEPIISYEAKYKRHIEDVKYSRNTFEKSTNLIMILWGAFLTLLFYKKDFLDAYPIFANILILCVTLLFFVFSIYLSRLVRIEANHFEVIKQFESGFDKKYNYYTYEETGFWKIITNTLLHLIVPSISVALPMVIWFSIFGLSYPLCLWQLSIIILTAVLTVVSAWRMFAVFYSKVSKNIK